MKSGKTKIAVVCGLLACLLSACQYRGGNTGTRSVPVKADAEQPASPSPSPSAAIGKNSRGKKAENKKEAKYAKKAVNWGLTFHEEHKTPSGEAPYQGFSLKQYGALYHGNTKQKKIYLSFDCGYENGYTKTILNILKENQVKAIFFVTKDYIEENPGLVKKMKKQGHLVGNHTVTHPRLSECSAKRIRKEVQGVESFMLEKTGYAIDKFIRPPEGNYSIHALKVLQKMGYTTVLWSLAWYDYDVEDQPSVDYVTDRFKKYHHRGMLPLFHVISRADTEALPEIISFMEGKGYAFDTVDAISLARKSVS